MLTKPAEIKTTHSKIADYAALMKLRLASLVVYSAILGYLLAPGPFSWMEILYLTVGGFLVTGSSNALNQIVEKDLDVKMKRTQNRPLPRQSITVTEAFVVALITGVVGITFLWQLNLFSAMLGLLALIMYAAVYTPLKTRTPLAVFVGAFPGSVPPMLGYIAATGKFGLEPGLLFAVQFFWQFPHFWAIAWKLHEDYTAGGFRLLPSLGGRDKRSAFIIMTYTALVIPVGMLPWAFDMLTAFSAAVAVVLGVLFLIPAIKLYTTQEMKYATQLMFFSFVYLPIIQLVFVLDRVFFM
jgi:heme o synthase